MNTGRGPPARFRLPVLLFAPFLALQAGSGAVLFALKLGTSPDSVARYYRGSDEALTRPKSPAGLLEVAVPHLLAIPLVLFAAAHLLALCGPSRAGPALAAAGFVGALGAILSPFAVRFVGAGCAWAKLASFIVLEAALVGLLALIAGRWSRMRPGAHRS